MHSTTTLRPPVYDPNTEGRRCSVCGERDRWRRIFVAPAGGWACCWADDGGVAHGMLAHTCSPRCAGAVRGAA